MGNLNNFFALLRIPQWSKAIFVMVGFFYSQESGFFVPVLLASLAFCFISSAVYIYNDIQDRSEDRVHPHKCTRPIASDKVNLRQAVAILFFLLITGLILGWSISRPLVLILAAYLIINLGYNHFFKLIPILDVVCIAAGFMLRVLAGTTGVGLPMSRWLLVAATMLSLFIAFNKRRLEINLGLSHPTRQVLKKYHPVVLQRLIIGSGALCFCIYLLYVVYAREESFYFLITLPFAAIALWRFAWLSGQNVADDDPVNVFLADRLSRLNFWCLAILTFLALSRPN